MQLVVIRHGETDLNKEDRLQGSKGPDLPLNETGVAQVTALRDALLVTPDIIYASPALRTTQTAQILNERLKKEIRFTPQLMERDFGSLSGKLRSEIDPSLVEADLEGRYDYRQYGGESVEDVTKRLQTFVAELHIQPEQTVLLVTHRGVIRILYDLYPMNASDESIVPASKHTFRISE